MGAGPTRTVDAAARLREIARLLNELASVLDRYRSLQVHLADAPGRTTTRRDRMRVIARRFPGAFRELDTVGDTGVAERLAAAEALAAALVTELDASSALASLAQADASWLRTVLEVQPQLREVLGLKKWLALDGGDPAAADTLARVRAWYADVAGEGDPGARDVPDAAALAAVASPPGGHLQRVAFQRAADALGEDASELATVLYAERVSEDDDGPDT